MEYSKSSLSIVSLFYLLVSSDCRECNQEPQEELQQQVAITAPAPEIENDVQQQLISPQEEPQPASSLEIVLGNLSNDPYTSFYYDCTDIFIRNHYQEALPVWNEFLRMSALAPAAIADLAAGMTAEERSEVLETSTIAVLPAVMHAIAYNYYQQLGDTHDIAVLRAVPLSILEGEPLSPETMSALSQLMTIDFQGSPRELLLAYVLQAQIYAHFIELQDFTEYYARINLPRGIRTMRCPYQGERGQPLGELTRAAYQTDFEAASSQTGLNIAREFLVESMQERRQIMNSAHIEVEPTQ